MGLDLGLEQTGRFEIVACIESEPAFCETIRQNQRAGRLSSNLNVLERDIRSLSPKNLLSAIGLAPGELDLLVGGPPCQSFSTAGKRRTVQDPRGTLVWQFVRFVEGLRPRFFLMENVRGLLSAAIRHRPIASRPENGGPPLERDEQPGSVVRLFAEDLQKVKGAAYHMDCFEVNAVNYGAPQLRERALFIGNRYNVEVEFPAPTHGPVCEGQPELFSQTRFRPWTTLGEILRGLEDTDPVILDFSPRKKAFLAMVPPGSNWRSLPTDIQRRSMGRAWKAKGGRSGWWRRLSYDLPSPTLVTMPNHASTALCHPEAVRSLTLREYARIQEFPDRWEFCGTPAEQYAQAGNAVPVRLGVVAGKVLAREMDRLRARGWKGLASRPQHYRVVYIQAHVRTRQWFKNGRVLVRTGKGSDETAYSPPKTTRKASVLRELEASYG